VSELISPYISVAEFRCSHCGRLPPGLKKDENLSWPLVFLYLFERFADLRERWGRAITISSGYRCFDHPLSRNGISVHNFGLALDLAITVDEMPSFIGMVDDMFPELRMGVNTKPGEVHVHIDNGFFIRPPYSDSLVEGSRWEE